MGWLSKIFGVSSPEGQYHGGGGYGEDTFWNYGPTTSIDSYPDYDNEDIDRAIALSLSEVDDHKGKKVIENDSQLNEDEQLARALQDSLNMDSPPRQDHGTTLRPQPNPFSFFYPPGYRICAGCKEDIGHGRFLSCMGGVWHPDCFRCHVCHTPISEYEFSMSGNRPYHKSCYKAMHHPQCDVCKNYIPANAGGLIEYRAHPFWMQKYCPSHEHDKTPRCCSCERMEPRDAPYMFLDDGRRLCLECLDSAIMDTHECQPLYLEIQEFYEGLNMKVEQQVPLLLVERQALNEAMEGEKNGHHHLPETRGLCLSEEQTISTITRKPRIGAGYRIIDMITEPFRLIRRCEVTAILILFGLPRLLTGSILAHEMMHAWLRLNGYPNLSPEVEEGICQVLAHMWLDSEVISSTGSSGSSASASASTSGPTSSKKGKRSEFEKKFGTTIPCTRAPIFAFHGRSGMAIGSEESTSGSNPSCSNNEAEAGDFECNICFDLAQDPIVTQCGHLFCWPCLYRWLRHHSQSHECPVCKALIQEDKLVPLYGRGKTTTDPRSRPIPGMEIPNRPSGQRPETAPPPPDQNHFSNFGFGLLGGFIPMATTTFGNMTLSAGFGGFGGLFPGFFNFQLHNGHGFPDPSMYGTPAHGFPQGYSQTSPANGSGVQQRTQSQDSFLTGLLVLIALFVFLTLF